MWRSRGGGGEHCLSHGWLPGYKEGTWPFHWENTQMPTSVYSFPTPLGCSIAQRGTPSILSLTGISLASSVLGLNGGRELAHSHLVCDFDLILLFLVRFSPPPPPPALPGWERDSYTSICGCEGQDTWDPAPCKFFNQTCHFQGHSKSFLASKISLASLIYFTSSSTHFFSGGFMLAEIIL